MLSKLLTVLTFLLAAGTAAAGDFDLRPLKSIPIQSGGRVKPLDSFARETVRFITGRESLQGKEPLAVLLEWVAFPGKWDGEEMILVEDPQLRELIKVPEGKRRASHDFLAGHEGFLAYAQDNFQKQERKDELNASQKESLAVFERVQLYRDVKSGLALTLVPIVHGEEGSWLSIGQLQMMDAHGKGKAPSAGRKLLAGLAAILSAYEANNLPGFTQASRDWAAALAQLGPGQYPDMEKIGLEVHYNSLAPFRKVYLLELIATVLAAALLISGAQALYWPAFGFFLSGILMGIYGFVLRILVAGRPPVTNMYESIVWVFFGSMVFALIFELVHRNRRFLLAGAILGVVGFLLADKVTGVLDPGLHPIEPVLRSNFWLTIHVLTITLSYGAFALALILGHFGLWAFWKRPVDMEEVKRWTQWIYRVVQVGVVLLTAGTILGGVWANYSWGRFWGWDPKETWALIALLGYVAILHGRMAGWFREFGFILGVVLAFLGILMAWYGVNFILGAGLHSYGFSKGGLGYVLGFVALELSLAAALSFRYKGRPAA